MNHPIHVDDLDWFAIEPGNRFFRVTAFWGLGALLRLLDQLPEQPEPTAGHLRRLLAPGEVAVDADEEEEQDPPSLASLVVVVRRVGPPGAKDALAGLVRALLRVPQPIRGEIFAVIRRALAPLPEHARIVSNGVESMVED